MRHPQLYRCAVILAAWLCVSAPPLSAADRESSPGIVFGGDITLSGAQSTVAAMAGSIAISDLRVERLVAAAGNVRIIDGDIGWLAVAGGSVALNGGRIGNVHAAAGDVKINTTINGDLNAMGGAIVLTNAARIDGDADLSGGDVIVDGTVNGDLTVRADHADLAGVVTGSVRLTAAEIKIAPGTRVNGDLVYTGPSDFVVPDSVTVGGKIVRADVVPWESASDTAASAARSFFHAAGIIFFGGLIVCGLLLWLVLPRVMDPTAATLTHAFPRSALTGFVLACAFPVVLLVMALTIIGIPLAFVTLAVGAAVTGLGILVFSNWIGDTLRQRLKRPSPSSKTARTGWMMGGLFAFLLVGVIPFIGGLVQMGATIAGIGALFLNLWKRRETALVP